MVVLRHLLQDGEHRVLELSDPLSAHGAADVQHEYSVLGDGDHGVGGDEVDKVSVQDLDLIGLILPVNIIVNCQLTSCDPIRGVSCLLYTSPSPRDGLLSRMPSSA